MHGVTKYFGFLTLACLAVLAFYSTPTMACSCLPVNPQAAYCSADYVILVRILRKSLSADKNQVIYKVEIKKTYKITPEGKKTLMNSRLVTASSSAACGVSLTIGKMYEIAGKGPQIGLCNYIKEYKQMSVIERRGFARVYRKGCKCEIKPCFGNDCLKETESATSCKWTPFADCQTNFSACLPTTIQTPEGPIRQCRWKRSRLYDECMSKV